MDKEVHFVTGVAKTIKGGSRRVVACRSTNQRSESDELQFAALLRLYEPDADGYVTLWESGYWYHLNYQLLVISLLSSHHVRAIFGCEAKLRLEFLTPSCCSRSSGIKQAKYGM